MKRQPAWLLHLQAALWGDQDKEQEQFDALLDQSPYPIDDTLRQTLRTAIEDVLKLDEPVASELSASNKITDSVLWSLADNTWNPSPVLQSLNTLCTQKKWTAQWSDDAFCVRVNDESFEIPESARPALWGVKKKQLKARLAAMVLIHHGGVLKKEWVSGHASE